jgi:hypothetical protein
MTNVRLFVGALALSGCGLISSDVTNFDLDLPSKTFSVDASGWQVNQTAADLYLGTTCDPAQSMPNICTSAVANACPMNCTGSCDTAAHKCDLGLQVAVHQAVDLLSEKPELKTINDQPIIHVTIDSLTYQVTANTLNTSTPEMKVYVAPMSVMDPNDPLAKQIGTIAAVPAMMIVAETPMVYTATGQQTLVDTMGDFKNPFNVIVGAQLDLRSGQMVPSGKLDANVHIKAHAAP